VNNRPFCQIINFVTKFILYIKYNSTLSLNKNLIISGSIGFYISLIVSYISAIYSTNNFANSALTVIVGFIFAKATFIILFHHDNKHKYTKKLTGKLNIYYLKQIAKKMIFAYSVFDIINNMSRFFILLELLRNQFQPVQAATISSILASSLSYLAINIIVKHIHVFGSKKKVF
jgi:hypothetical protein